MGVCTKERKGVTAEVYSGPLPARIHLFVYWLLCADDDERKVGFSTVLMMMFIPVFQRTISWRECAAALFAGEHGR